MENLKMKEILNSINMTSKIVTVHLNYSTCPGIYAFRLAENIDLGIFGKSGKIIYVGIAKDSLKNRDLNQHFKTGRTGSSTLRRSLGAILKTELTLRAIPRGNENDSKRFINYAFECNGDERLTKWMCASLKIGYWEDVNFLDYGSLRELEKNLIIEVKPTLDLDKRTKKYNVMSDKLDELRKICREESKNYK